MDNLGSFKNTREIVSLNECNSSVSSISIFIYFSPKPHYNMVKYMYNENKKELEKIEFKDDYVKTQITNYENILNSI